MKVIVLTWGGLTDVKIGNPKYGVKLDVRSQQRS